jgi:hypothetical protein
VGDDGQVAQYVPERDTAWHAGNWLANLETIGIEHSGFHPLEGFWSPTEAQFLASAQLAADICRRWGITPSSSTIVPHSSINLAKPLCPGGGFDFEAYIAVVQELLTPPVTAELPVRLFDPGSNTQIGTGTAIANTDKVYVKTLGPLRAAAGQAERGAEMGKVLGGFYDSTWVNGGILGKVVFGIVVAFVAVLLVLAFAALGGSVRAQELDPFNPATWFTSTEAVIALVGIFMGWIVKLATALGKDLFSTSGSATVVLSAVLAVLIAGFGGYQMLGVFGEGAGGLQGAVQAAFVVLVAFFGSNASAKADRQAVAGGARRLDEADERAAAKARLQ